MGVGQGPTRRRAERVEEVAALRGLGLTYTEIGLELGISRSYASALFNDPLGVQDQNRKDSYRGRCERCGDQTTGSDGHRNAPRCCHLCSPIVYRKWTREKIIEAVQEWARRRGRAPTASDWNGPNITDPDGYEFPGAGSVYDNRSKYTKRTRRHGRPFDNWSDAIEAAGFARPRSNRNYVDREKWEVDKMGEASIVRPYLVFVVEEQGTYKVLAECEAKNNAEAIEICAQEAGHYAAVAKNSLTEYVVEPRLVATIASAENDRKVGAAN